MNIVLIGMPGSGKSTVGAMLARRTGRSFIETDALIEAREGASIPALFAGRGESGFRDAEHAAVRAAAAAEHAVIATGGGVILRPENMEALSADGAVFFLDRAPEEIAGEEHGGRPLLAGDRRRVFELYTQRIALYRKYASYVIAAGNTPEESLERLIETMEREGLL